jgi:type VI secretion system secreted protein Hcp
MSIFARIGTIKGESHDARHRDEIDVLSWSWGVSRSGPAGHAGGGAGAGRASFHDFTFTHHVDKASPLLMTACATGRHVSDARVTVGKAGAGQQEYLVITMTDVLVTAVLPSVSEQGVATEGVVLTFAKVDLEYRPQKPDGSLDAGVHFRYDVQAQREG